MSFLTSGVLFLVPGSFCSTTSGMRRELQTDTKRPDTYVWPVFVSGAWREHSAQPKEWCSSGETGHEEMRWTHVQSCCYPLHWQLTGCSRYNVGTTWIHWANAMIQLRTFSLFWPGGHGIKSFGGLGSQIGGPPSHLYPLFSLSPVQETIRIR